MSCEDVANFLRVHPNTVRNLVDRGELGAFKIGRVLRFLECDVRLYLSNARTA